MLSGEPETTELPMRRLGMTLIGSLVVSAIVLAGVGIYGYINPSGGEPAENDIIVMRETGARFVYIDGYLHPVPNLTSAQLIVGSDATPRTMSRESLADIPRGKTVGISNAPDPAPDADSLITLPWTVCAAQTTQTTTTTTQLTIGTTPTGGTTLDDQAILVTTTDNDLPLYLLYHNQRLTIDDRTVLTALELASNTPVKVSTQLLNTIPAGPDLAPITLPQQGQTSPKQVAGKTATIGTLYQSGQQHYILTATGLSPIGELMATLLTATGTQTTQITAQQAADALTTEQTEPDDFPATTPTVLSGADTEICATYQTDTTGQTTTNTITIQTYPAGQALQTTDSQSAATNDSDGTTADQVIIPNGHGALVQPLPEPGVTANTTLYLITDQGLAYPLADSDTITTKDALGYSDTTPTLIPTTLLTLIPTGPTLDPDTARNYLSTTETDAQTNTETTTSPTTTTPTTTTPTTSSSPTTPKATTSATKASPTTSGPRTSTSPSS